jgi:hypothetical protein
MITIFVKSSDPPPTSDASLRSGIYMSGRGIMVPPGAKLEGGVGGVTPPKARLAGQIIWIGRANHLDWQGNEIF